MKCAFFWAHEVIKSDYLLPETSKEPQKTKELLIKSFQQEVKDEVEGAFPGVDDLLAGEEIFRNPRSGRAS